MEQLLKENDHGGWYSRAQSQYYDYDRNPYCTFAISELRMIYTKNTTLRCK